MFDDKANFAIHANFCERDLVWTFFPSLAEALRTTQRVDVPVRIILQDGQDRIRIGQDKTIYLSCPILLYPVYLVK